MIELSPNVFAAPQAERNAFDLNGRPPSESDPAELRKAAQQFEALLIQQMLKEMRSSSLDEGGLFSGSQMDGYQQMFDQEIALKMAENKGFGLADRMLEQIRMREAARSSDAKASGAVSLNENSGDALPIDRTRIVPTLRGAPVQEMRGADPVERPAVAPKATSEPADVGARAAAFESREDFIDTLMPLARSAARRLGVPAEAIVAQAALETGWGQHMLTTEDGRPGWNLFGIKAGPGWDGDSLSARTLELRDGTLQPERAWFRIYDSPREAVQDYVEFLSGSSRYAQALADGRDTSSFADGLQRAGYATDPDYAAKIQRVAASLPERTDA